MSKHHKIPDDLIAFLKSENDIDRLWSKVVDSIKNSEQAFDIFDAVIQHFQSNKEVLKQIKFLIKCGTFCNNKGNYEKAQQYLHQAFDIIKNGQDFIDEKFEYLVLWGLIHTNLTEYKTAKTYFEQAESLLPEVTSNKLKGKYYLNLGHLLKKSDTLDKAKESILKSFAYYRAANDQKGIIYAHLNLGDVLFGMGNYREALTCFHKAYKATYPPEYQNLRAYTLNNLGYIYLINKQYDFALDYLQQSLALKIKSKDTAHINSAYLNIGDIYLRLNEYPQAIQALTESLRLSREIGDKEISCKSLFLLGEVYGETGELTIAHTHLQDALSMAEQEGLSQLTVRGAMLLGVLYYRMGEVEKSEQLLNRALAAPENQLGKHHRKEAYRYLSKIHEERGEQLIALQHLQTYITLLDSISDETKRDLRQFHIEREKHRQEADIFQLQQQLNEQERHFFTKQQQLQELISRALHQNVGSQLSGTKLHLQILKNELQTLLPPEHHADILKKFDTLIGYIVDVYKDTRQLSHNLISAENFTANLRDSLLSLVERVRIQSGLDITYHERGLDQIRNTTIRAILLSALQELLTNIIKHAQATKIIINIKDTEGTIHLNVTDNGRGFEAHILTDGIGLTTIRRDVEGCGGIFTIASMDEGGTQASIAISLS